MKTAPRQRGALVWLAILTIAAAGVVQAEGSRLGPAPYTQSMLRFLAAHQDVDALAAGMPRFLERWSGGLFAQANRAGAQRGHSDFWLSMLPVVFVGLAMPLILLAALAQSLHSRAIASATSPVCYKRPPPSLLA
jgi:hypothetical protein